MILTVSNANTIVSFSTVSDFIIQIRVGITGHLKALYDSQRECKTAARKILTYWLFLVSLLVWLTLSQVSGGADRLRVRPVEVREVGVLDPEPPVVTARLKIALYQDRITQSISPVAPPAEKTGIF